MASSSIRKLGAIEYCWAKMDEFVPVTFVGVLHLTNGPAPEVLQQALDTLQARQIMLRIALVKRNGDFHFCEAATSHPVQLQTLERNGDDGWQECAEHHLNTPIDAAVPPLARCTYLDGKNRSELVFSFHHSIIDARSGQEFVYQLLNECAAIEAGSTDREGVSQPACQPAMEDIYPPEFKGVQRILRAASFMFQQMAEEFSYRRRLGQKQPLHQHSQTKCRVLSIELPEDTTNKLSRSARRRRIPLNSVLHAAMLISLFEHRYAGQSLPMRGISFADMRPHLTPPVPSTIMGVYISMLQYTVSFSSKCDFWILAADIRDKIYRATKNGDKFIAALLSKHLIRFLIWRQSMRMGMVALSYVGPMKTEPAYGTTVLDGLSGFVANNVLGPELAGFGKILNGRLSLDLLYLDSDMDSDMAYAIAECIKSILENLPLETGPTCQ